MRKALVSIVVPVYDEAESVRQLCSVVARVLGLEEDLDYEILLVDDGSRDLSWRIISDLHKDDDRIKGVRLSRNFGHQAALTAGLHYAIGDAVVTMDGDLQHPPELLPAMIERWRQGYDVVSMVREPSEQESWFKKQSSNMFYRLMNGLSDIKIKGSVADFRLLDRRVVKRLNSLKERGRFVRGLISWIGYSETEIRYKASPRYAGQPKYSLRKMLGLAGSAVSSFSTVPLKLGFHVGIAVNLLCLALMAYALYTKIYDHKDLSEWASSYITMLFLHGIQLIMIGVIGVYLGRVLEEVKRRPLFVASEELGVAPRPRRISTKRQARIQSHAPSTEVVSVERGDAVRGRAVGSPAV
ncbi:MAG: glycosyltransferase family 2 protein [Acidobacteriota bacterium]